MRVGDIVIQKAQFRQVRDKAGAELAPGILLLVARFQQVRLDGL